MKNHLGCNQYDLIILAQDYIVHYTQDSLPVYFAHNKHIIQNNKF